MSIKVLFFYKKNKVSGSPFIMAALTVPSRVEEPMRTCCSFYTVSPSLYLLSFFLSRYTVFLFCSYFCFHTFPTVWITQKFLLLYLRML